jgi:hypothetical protein
MSRPRKWLIASLVALGAVLVVSTAVAYRVIVDRWGADPRGTLIAAAVIGISFFVSMNLLLAWDERRRTRLGLRNEGSVVPRADGAQIVDATPKGEG